MKESFSTMLAVGGKKNSLGQVNDVVTLVLNDKSRLEELYENITTHEDAWVRMRAIDAFEKICREHPEWIKPYINRMQNDIALSTQPSIQWHLAQMYDQVELSDPQKIKALHWLKSQLSTPDADWIVAANCMKTLAHFTKRGDVPASELITAVSTQLNHKSNTVIKKAQKILSEFS